MEHNSTTALHYPPKPGIQLIYPPLGVINAVIDSLGDEMMEIDTGCVVLQRMSQVEIALARYHADGSTRCHRIHARVTRHQHGKATLCLIRCNHEALRALHGLFHNRT